MMHDNQAIDELLLLLSSRTDTTSGIVRRLVQESGILEFFSASGATTLGSVEAVGSQLEAELRQSISPVRALSKSDSLGVFRLNNEELIGAAQEELTNTQCPAFLLVVTILQASIHRERNSFLNIRNLLKIWSALLDVADRETQWRCGVLLLQILSAIEGDDPIA